MNMMLQDHSRTRIYIPRIPLAKGAAWGFTGGLAATLVMDMILMGSFAAAGMLPFTCFSIIGDTVASLFSLEDITTAASVALGIIAHYVIGPVLGGVFGILVSQVRRLRLDTLKKAIVIAVLYTEILSQPMIAMTPILLGMTASDTLEWYGGSFAMHLIWGCILGVVMKWGLRLPAAAAPKW